MADEQLLNDKGYDHNFVINQNGISGLHQAAKVYAPETGIQMGIFTTEPGMQFYSGNFLNETIIGKANISYNYRTGFCLETQHFPDSPNQPSFPSTVLEPSQIFKSRSIYKFSLNK